MIGNILELRLVVKYCLLITLVRELLVRAAMKSNAMLTDYT